MAIYSHSRLSSFEQCRLKYRFSYVDRIAREEQSIEAFMGSRFHEAMEKLYMELPFRIADSSDLKRFFEERWEKSFGPHVFIIRKERSPEDYKRIGLRAIEEYCRRYHPYDDAKTLGVERRIVVNLGGGGDHRVQCYIDRLAMRPDGVLEIHDYKTSGTLPEQKRLDSDRQLGLYEIAARSAWPDTGDVELVWHFVAFDREMRSRRTRAELDELVKSTSALIDEIESCTDFPPTESSLCPYCSFQDICPLFSHLFSSEEMPGKKGIEDDGAALVDRFTELEAKKRELRARLQAISDEEEALKAAAVSISEREGATRLFGHDHKLTLRKDLVLHYPKSGEPGRNAFERAMRESGLWERCADINYMTLHGIARRERWLDSVPEGIGEFVEVEPRKKITLSKRKDVEEDEGGDDA
ncbi:MAG TPA: PD-(D/E)XK nuclease family protein [bacterium]|nr:PD-(D/E)XK nuclease family protein [bacterium]